jgi:alpha-tubulin suppressor-like RCC1 family protein
MPVVGDNSYIATAISVYVASSESGTPAVLASTDDGALLYWGHLAYYNNTGSIARREYAYPVLMAGAFDSTETPRLVYTTAKCSATFADPGANKSTFLLGSNEFGVVSATIPTDWYSYYPEVINVKTATSALSQHMAALDSSRNLIIWGKNDKNQCGVDGVSMVSMGDSVIPGPFLDVAVGTDFTLAIKADGTLWAVGNNDSGQCGIPGYQIIPMLTQVGNDRWASVQCGSNHTLVLDLYGFLHGMGANDKGQLGTGDLQDRDTPTKLNDRRWACFDAGHEYSLACENWVSLYGWGTDTLGQLGMGSIGGLYTVPTPCATYDDGGGHFYELGRIVRQISCGYDHSIVMCWGNDGFGSQYKPFFVTGSNAHKKLGFHTAESSWPLDYISIFRAPGMAEFLFFYNNSETAVRSVSAGYMHTAVADESYNVYMTGDNSYGQIGTNSTGSTQAPWVIGPEFTTTNATYSQVVCGLDFTCALTAGGTILVPDTTLPRTLNNPNAYGSSADDVFGFSVAISGNYCIVGAPYEDDAGVTSSGKVYIFDVTTGALLRTLNNPNAYGTSDSDVFGFSVAISGNYCIVGAYMEDDTTGTESGKAYIFDVTTGALLRTLSDPNAYGTSDDYFGHSVAISGNYCIVGAFREDDAGGTDSGKAYIFNVTTGSLLFTLDNPNAYGTSSDDYFGRAVAISGNYCIVGAYLEDNAIGTASGKAYIFNVTTGSLLFTLNDPNAYSTSSDDYFGRAVAISGNYCIVGAYLEDDAGGTGSGKAYIFNATTGALLYTLDNPNAYGTSSSDQFGYSVAISGNYCIVGAYQEGDTGGYASGKAYIFDATTGALLYTLDNPNAYGTSSSDQFGIAVSISDNYCIVGAPYEADATGNAYSGKAYIFGIT